MRDTTAPHMQAAALAQHIEDTLGPAQAWAATVTTLDGREFVIFPPGQNPAVTSQQFADALHAMTCSGCGDCERTAQN